MHRFSHYVLRHIPARLKPSTTDQNLFVLPAEIGIGGCGRQQWLLQPYPASATREAPQVMRKTSPR